MTDKAVLPIKLEYGHKDVGALSDYVNTQLAAIQRRMDQGIHHSQLNVLNSAPFRTRIGMIAYADGTHWNPGSGEGLYVFKSSGWKFIA